MPIELQYKSRTYQNAGPRAILRDGKLRYCGIMHRRAGKDRTWWNFTILQAMRKPALYYYCLPTFAWAKDVIWYGIWREIRYGIEYSGRFLSDIPSEVLADPPYHEADLRINFRNGSIIKLVGSDNIASGRVGTNPSGIVFSEYSIGTPEGWDFVRPILSENKGWAAFIYTPRGRNHGYELYQNAKNNDEWFCEILTVDDTRRDGPAEDGGPVIANEAIELERKSGMPEELIQQEYYCSFAAFIAGSYFGRQLEHLRQNDHVRRIAYDMNLLVHTAWDLGVNNATAIWFFQMNGNEIRVIDYFEASGEGLPFYVAYIKSLEYNGGYGSHLAPHDIRNRDFSTGVSRWETAANLGLTFTPVPRLAKTDQRNAVYAMLNRCYFDSNLTEPGLTYLGEYHPRRGSDGSYSMNPEHDHTSNAADAFQLLAVGLSQVENTTPDYAYAITEFDPIYDTTY